MALLAVLPVVRLHVKKFGYRKLPVVGQCNFHQSSFSRLRHLAAISDRTYCLGHRSIHTPVKNSTSESYELPGSDGIRVSKLISSENLQSFLYEDVKTLVDALERGCRVSENGPFVGWQKVDSEYTWITYRQFIDRAKNFGSGLINLGINLGQSTSVGIYAQNSVEWAVAEFGCLYYSSRIVSMYETFRPNESVYVINHADLSVIVCDTGKKVKSLLDRRKDIPDLKYIIYMYEVENALKELAKSSGVSLLSMKDIEALGKTNPVPVNMPKPTDEYIMLYTSGTTGIPKGVILTHQNLVITAGSLFTHLGDGVINKSDCMISYLPLGHIYEICMQLIICMQGGRLGFFRGKLDLLEEDWRVLKPTIIPLVPRLLNRIYEKNMSQIKSNERKVSDSESVEEKDKTRTVEPILDPVMKKAILESLGGRVKLLFTGAAPINPEVLTFFNQTLGIQMIELYGQTESTGPVTGNVVTKDCHGHVGTPLPSCMIKLVDVPELGYYKKDNIGQVCIKGYNVFKGYFKDAQKTAEVLDSDGWLYTGDVGIFLPGGALKIIDRMKQIIKLSQGEFVSLERTESVYLRSPYISQIIVHGDSLQNHLVAVVIPDQSAILSWKENNSKSASWPEVCNDPEVKKLILENMQQLANADGLFSFQQVKSVYLHPTLLSFEQGHLTPTQKTKRDICQKFFAKEIKAMYSNKDD